MKSSLTLYGATGATVGRARQSDSFRGYSAVWFKRRFVIDSPVAIDEGLLREIFTTLRSFWPPVDPQILASLQNRTYRQKRAFPDVGFQLTGEVESGDGFFISWEAGTVRGRANGCLLGFDMDPSCPGYADIKSTIDDLVNGGQEVG
ncbi:hypothetical protein FYK55_17105 [Roseiconus nitratireducens]|uniref:Uncharacterized protein n=1 Tax=Roseiconus nitratireducens TaxID=2605748 RepID=A0A5M6D357_9BACT|nr:hypothetical protein [Roseiconus nitratireducens]KAA5541914.1 hypothetical protein FYK55_17105 [Roseiconus nitratireducens]